jgi:DDE superfamily endonuclease
VRKDGYDTLSLIEVLTRLGAFYAGEQVVLVWDGLSAHWSHDMRAFIDTQRDWLEVERLPGYAPKLNPVAYLWANLKGVELANFAGDTSSRSPTPPSGESTGCAMTSSWSGRSWPTPASPSTTSTYPTYEKLNR